MFHDEYKSQNCGVGFLVGKVVLPTFIWRWFRRSRQWTRAMTSIGFTFSVSMRTQPPCQAPTWKVTKETWHTDAQHCECDETECPLFGWAMTRARVGRRQTTAAWVIVFVIWALVIILFEGIYLKEMKHRFNQKIHNYGCIGKLRFGGGFSNEVFGKGNVRSCWFLLRWRDDAAEGGGESEKNEAIPFTQHMQVSTSTQQSSLAEPQFIGCCSRQEAHRHFPHWGQRKVSVDDAPLSRGL